ncbi:putative G-protein coupled receptor 139 [Mustelus asterias]
MDPDLEAIDWNVTAMDRSFLATIYAIAAYYDVLATEDRIFFIIFIIQKLYYPILAAVAVPVNLVTIFILYQGKCGLSKCITRYLVAMAVADLLVVIFDLIMRHIPIVYPDEFVFLESVPVCNIHAVVIYAVTDLSVWFTVTFSFDRCVAICSQKLKSTYCTEKTASAVLATVTVVSCSKNITWYFTLEGQYSLMNFPWFCDPTGSFLSSLVWASIDLLYFIITPLVPFALILLLNVFTIRHILVNSKARRRLRAHSKGERLRDPEMESRRKSIILLFVLSANFILLWSLMTSYFLWFRIVYFTKKNKNVSQFVEELGFMLQLLSCCTNTCIYAATQTKFREQVKNLLRYPIHAFVHFRTK